MAKGKSSKLPAAAMNALASSLSGSEKKPMTATSVSATKALASSREARVLAAGPVFFSSHDTMVSAVRPGWGRGELVMAEATPKTYSEKVQFLDVWCPLSH